MVMNTIDVNLIEVTNKLEINSKTREWCKLPYPNHPNGCPNFNKNPDCPPTCKFISDFIDLTKKVYFVIVKFDLQKHIISMMQKHPDWSCNQAKCCLYYQNTLRKALKDKILYTFSIKEFNYTLVPEAMGVNVMLTLRNIRYDFEIKPVNFVNKVALIGHIIKNK